MSDSKDSIHYTVNWLPMRIIVNRFRWELTGLAKFKIKAEKLEDKLRLAFNSEGFFEDRLPLGTSFNLQYAISTLAILDYGDIQIKDVNFDEAFIALRNERDFTNDINHYGRGANQIFAWGPWIYLCAKRGDLTGLKYAMNFLEKRLSTSLENNNIHLNEYEGRDGFFWTDYHYCSVYFAHLYFWLSLAKQSLAISKEIVPAEKITENECHKLNIFGPFKVTSYPGTSEYTCERGPRISTITHPTLGAFIKSSTGPFEDFFSQKYSTRLIASGNIFGFTSTVYRGRLLTKVFKIKRKYKTVDLWPSYSISYVDDVLRVSWNISAFGDVRLSLPLLKSRSRDINYRVLVDERLVSNREVGEIKGVYGENVLIETEQISGSLVTLELYENSTDK